MELDLSWSVLWNGLFWPLLRLTFFISVALLVGILIESLRWTRYVAAIAAPLARRARLKDVSAASFTMSFFSGFTANTMLSEAYARKEISDRELVLSNLFNSLPAYFLHLPTILIVSSQFVGGAGYIYVGLSALAALLRTAVIVVSGRFLLPPIPEGSVPRELNGPEKGLGENSVFEKTWSRFRKRLPKILYITFPVYTLFFLLKQAGFFSWIESALGGAIPLFAFLPPEAFGIVAFHMAAEFNAALAAAGAMMADASLTRTQVVLALMLGNVLSSPMRAFRHQFPYYAGIFRPRVS